MPYTDNEDQFSERDQTFEYQTYSAEGTKQTCKGCGEEICSFTPFCGYCGLKNLRFNFQLFQATFGHTIEQACKEMCTSSWHMTTVEWWTDTTEAALAAQRRLLQSGIRPADLHYCPRCGVELISDPQARAWEVEDLINDLRS